MAWTGVRCMAVELTTSQLEALVRREERERAEERGSVGICRASSRRVLNGTQ